MLLACCLHVTAQSKKQIDSAKQRERKARIDATYLQYEAAKMTGKINLLSLMDPEAPTIQTGVEFAISKRVSAEVTYGIPVPIHGNVRNTDTTYYRYYKFRAEMRFFPFERKAWYFAPEITYTSKEYSKFDGSYYSKDDGRYEYDFAEIDKSIIAGACKIGYVSPFRRNNRLILDVFFGFGPRFNRMKIKPVNAQQGGFGWMTFFTNDREGTTTAVHATMGIKIGYIIF